MADKIELEEIHKEIDLVQGCINRMASNSFMIKGWTITIYAVVLALLPEKVNTVLICVVMLTVTWAFWYLDSFFLRTEKIYRKIYDWILEERPKNNRDLLYQLNPVKFKGKILDTENINEIMFSKTLRMFYGIPTFILVVILITQFLPFLCLLCNDIQ
ncbi:MAG: hypothetical protein K0Q87_400 [Neobacillus sp.]|nr:hypothetical protein [Neobacillus sp.]